MEQNLANKHGTRVTFHLKSNNTLYQEMHNFIVKQAGTSPNLLMVGGRIFWYRKWVTFYMKRGKADLLKKTLKEDPKSQEKFEIEFTDRMGENSCQGVETGILSCPMQK